MTVAIVQPTILLAMCLFTLLKAPWTIGNALLLGLFSLVLVDTALVLMVTLGGMAKVHNLSKGAIHTMKSCGENFSNGESNNFLRPRDIKWQVRFAESCCPIRVKFGSNNFVEDNTPLNCISQAFDLTVQLLLLGV